MSEVLWTGEDEAAILKPSSLDRSARVRVSVIDGSYAVHPPSSAQGMSGAVISEPRENDSSSGEEIVDVIVSLQSYANQHVVVITQTQKFGNVVSGCPSRAHLPYRLYINLYMCMQISAWAEEKMSVSFSAAGGDLGHQSAGGTEGATSDNPSPGGGINRRLIFRTATLLGRRDDPLLDIYARQIIERIASTGDTRSLLLFICLQSPGSCSETDADAEADSKATSVGEAARKGAGRSAKCLNAALNVLYELAGW
jgi:hypothetical protein